MSCVHEHMAEMSASRKSSVVSCDEGLTDRSDCVYSKASGCETTDFTGPIDEILGLIKNVFDKKAKISAKDKQFVEEKAHEMKNRIINHLLLKDKSNTSAIKFSTNERETLKINDYEKWPPLKSNANKHTQFLGRGRPHSTVIVKSDSDRKLKTSEVNKVESQVNQMLSAENINATIHSSLQTRNGDVVIKFDESDDVQAIARKMENKLGYKAHSRSFLLQKMTISYVPKYISLDESVTELIIKSNKWLDEMIQKGESFKVLFTYEVKDWDSIVCKVSPKVRAEIIQRGNTIKIENRSCPIKDRFHILQCGNCLGFGHRTRMCTKDTLSCSHCGEDHRWKDCSHRDQDEKAHCSNCGKSRSDESSCNSTKHSARSHSCPLYIKQLKKQVEMTSWGDGPVPTI